MSEFLSTLNYDFLWGMCVGVAFTIVAWIVLRPSSSALSPVITEPKTSTSDPRQLTLPFDVPSVPSVDVLPASPLPTNVTMTIAPTIVPRTNDPSPVVDAPRRGRPKNSSTSKKKTSKSTKTPRRTTSPRRKQTRPSMSQFFRRLISIN